MSNVTIPKIVERKILVIKKKSGAKQYLMTLPKEYALKLEKKGVKSLFVVFNGGLGAFPKIPGFTEKALLTFLRHHPDLTRLYADIEVGVSNKKPAKSPNNSKHCQGEASHNG